MRITGLLARASRYLSRFAFIWMLPSMKNLYCVVESSLDRVLHFTSLLNKTEWSAVYFPHICSKSKPFLVEVWAVKHSIQVALSVNKHMFIHICNQPLIQSTEQVKVTETLVMGGENRNLVLKIMYNRHFSACYPLTLYTFTSQRSGEVTRKHCQDRHVERLLTRNKLERGRRGSKNTGFKTKYKKKNNHRTGK